MLNDLYDIFNRHDPQGLINMGAPSDEYNSEITMLIDNGVDAFDDVNKLAKRLYAIFVEMFDDSAGTVDSYVDLAAELFGYLRDEGLINRN